MTTCVALLRGINVGRAKRISMADLRSLLEALGYDDVRTHLQSGNALFTTGARTAAVAQAVEDAIRDELGMTVRVLVRTASELAAAVAANPFPARGVDVRELHATFLSEAPRRAAFAAVDLEAAAPDEVELGDRVLYARLPNGVAGSKLPDWERALGITATTRSWKTVTRLHELTGG